MKRQFYRIISFILCCVMMFSLCACNSGSADGENVSLVPPTNTGFWGEPNDSTSDGSSWDTDLTPNVNITVIGGGKKEEDIGSEIDAGIIDNIYSLVCSAVTKDLEEDGFSCGVGVATTVEDDHYSGLGIYYSSPEFQIFDSASGIECVGFVEVVSADVETYSSDMEESIIVVNDINEIEDATDIVDETQKICTYNYENIGSYHFVYQDKYVVYYQETAMRVVYRILDNQRKNYDLTLGSLYDYDNKQYIYDESIFGEYKNHSAVELFGEEDYTKLESELQVLSEQQLANGYEVLEFNIVYISPESIQAYLSSEEEDTFFGYNVDELTAAFGLGTALTYNGTTFEKSTIIPKEEGYNWKSFLIKMGIGCGIILVGAILSPVTGGASFGCALLTISKVAVSYALTSAIGTLAIETVSGLIQGKTIEDSLKGATHKGLDAFANGFMIGAAIGSVGLLTGVIKPSACFIAGTLIATCYNTFKCIEDVHVGDYVLSYSENDRTVSRQKVIDTFSKEVYQTIGLTIDGGYIETTYNHPFYSPVYNCWVEAGSLRVGDYVVDSDGNSQVVQETKINSFTHPVTVYNFTVENNHTYFVGEREVLVHNECTTLQSKRNKAVSEAWKKEKQAVMDGTSKYNWTSAQKKELLTTGKIKGQAGHHIKPVNELIGTAHEHLISDPNNIVFLSDDVHKWVHLVGDSFEKTAPRVVQVMPWTAKVIAKLGMIA
ncbi:MAG TPA: hypothetical protein DHU65_00155 [Clostridiales bacterium]|nr:hypothetical protein [Clostridiales bacterium]